MIARWPVIPASEVPDDLVDQAMSVLQDKSRETVIRELQRTVELTREENPVIIIMITLICGRIWM